MKRVKLEDLQAQAQYLRLLVYGEPGAGKSWLCASACLTPETAPVLYLDYLGQVASLKSNPEYRKAMEDGRLVLLQLEKYADLNQVYSFLSTGKGPLADVMAMPKTLILDSLTELQRAEVMRRAGNKSGTFLTDIEPPQIQHWGTLLSQFTLLAKMLYDLPMHVVLTSLESVQLDMREKIESRRPALQGSAKRLLPAYALTLMHLQRAARNMKGHNVGHTNSTVARSKDQTGMFPAKVVSPTIPLLVKLLNKST